MRRRRLVTFCLSAVLLASAGCGDDGREGAGGAGGGREGGSPGAVLAAAGQETLDAGSSRMAISVDAGPQMTFTGEGVFDYENRSGSMTLDLGQLGAMFGGGAGAQFEMRIIGSVIYMKMPAGIPGLDPSRPWMKIDVEQAAQESGFASFDQFTQMDPSTFLQYLEGVGDDIEKVGTDEVRGESATHYSGTVDLAKALEEAEPAAKEALAAQIEQLGDLGDVPIDVWIDDAGRMRKMVQTISMSDLAAAASSTIPPGTPETLTTTIELFDFGVDVDVQAPPDAETFDLPTSVGGADQ